MKKRFTVLILCVLLLLSGSVTALADDIEETTPSGRPLSTIEDFIDDYMDKYIGKSSPGAAVVLVKDGEIIFSKGYGYSDIESKTPVSPDTTVFEYGSVSKLFVYTTIMRLSEQGKIDLKADIRQYLPEGFLRKLQYDKPITMIDIMNHTTGFEDYYFDVILTSTDNLPSFAQTIKQCQPRQVYEPGTISAYSNYAVGLAGYIAEQIIGQDFHEYLMETVFLPLDMGSTSIHTTLEDKPELLDSKATGYRSQGDGSFTPYGWSYIPLYPVGAANGTANDLAQFAMAFMPEEGQNSPLFEKRETLDTMLTQTLGMGGPGMTGFAHGFIEWDGEFRGVGHGGNTAAFSAQMNIVPEERFGVIMLTNAYAEMDITSGLTEALIGKRDNEIFIDTTDLPDASEVEGTYISARRMHTGFLELYEYLNPLDVKMVEQNKIQLSLAGQTSTMIQTSPYVYQCEDANGSIFEYNFKTVYFEVSDGKVVRMSGDLMPLPKARLWLNLSLLFAMLSTLYFLIAPLVILIRKLIRKNKRQNKSAYKKVFLLLVLNGTALVANNTILLLRMLMNNYRSFYEFRIHILLNYPLVILAAVLGVLLIVKRKGANLSRVQKILSLITIILIAALIILLISWQFLNVIA